MRGPPPVYRPRFTLAELNQARDAIRPHNAPQAKARRARLALLLAQNPKLDNVSAGKQLGVHPNTVRYWRKRWVEKGFCLDDEPRTGRPRIFFPADRRHR